MGIQSKQSIHLKKEFTASDCAEKTSKTSLIFQNRIEEYEYKQLRDNVEKTLKYAAEKSIQIYIDLPGNIFECLVSHDSNDILGSINNPGHLSKRNIRNLQNEMTKKGFEIHLESTTYIGCISRGYTMKISLPSQGIAIEEEEQLLNLAIKEVSEVIEKEITRNPGIITHYFTLPIKKHLSHTQKESELNTLATQIVAKELEKKGFLISFDSRSELSVTNPLLQNEQPQSIWEEMISLWPFQFPVSKDKII